MLFQLSWTSLVHIQLNQMTCKEQKKLELHFRSNESEMRMLSVGKDSPQIPHPGGSELRALRALNQLVQTPSYFSSSRSTEVSPGSSCPRDHGPRAKEEPVSAQLQAAVFSLVSFYFAVVDAVLLQLFQNLPPGKTRPLGDHLQGPRIPQRLQLLC